MFKIARLIEPAVFQIRTLYLKSTDQEGIDMNSRFLILMLFLFISTGALGDGSSDLYRFLNTNTFSHYYTANEVERDLLIRNPRAGFIYKGPVWSVKAVPDDEAVPVYRFFNQITGVYFYTASTEEKAYFEEILPNWIFEGIAWYTYPDIAANVIPVYRYWDFQTDAPYYTAEESVMAEIALNYPHIIYQGIAWYANPKLNTDYDLPSLTEYPTQSTRAFVKEIVNADTLRVEIHGEDDFVRLIGIDAPKVGECLYRETIGQLQRLMVGSYALLQRDVVDRDIYGRLLRYISMNADDINFRVVREGYAKAVGYPPNTVNWVDLGYAQALSQIQSLGIWGGCSGQIFFIQANASPSYAGRVNCTPATTDWAGSSSCNAEPAPGFQFVGWSGACSGQNSLCILYDIRENSFVTARFEEIPATVYGLCGLSNGKSQISMPLQDLCKSGQATTVVGTGPWFWTCKGANGGGDESCMSYQE
jgi:endonuclease YncB( thermonuclease family)